MSILSLPENVFEKMMCVECNNLLSIYPVFLKRNAGGAYCGRCKPKDVSNMHRDEAYEIMAQFLLFPCMYKGNGCTKNLSPSHLEQHEPCCDFKKFICPIAKCDWEGPRNCMFAHFGEKHETLVVDDQKFQIDFINNLEQTMLMKADDELFLIKTDIDARKELFKCTVEHLKSNETNDVYNYYLKIESDNRNYFHSCNEYLANGEYETKLFADFLKDKLHDAESMIVTVQVLKSNAESSEVKIMVSVTANV